MVTQPDKAALADMQRYIIRLEVENWQLKQACGYPIPANKETINNPFKCGICDARRADDGMRLATIERAVSEVCSSRDDLGHTHFLEITEAIKAALAAPGEMG